MSEVDQLASWISEQINCARKKANLQFVRVGKVSGNTIEVDGKIYPVEFAVNVSVHDGDWVYASITEDGRAVVIGD